MKKKLIIIFAIVCSCFSEKDEINISGEIKGLNNSFIYLIQADSNTLLDSSKVENEKFDLVHRLPCKVLADAYQSIENNMSGITSFVGQWLAYQALWDTQVSDVATLVGTDINKWQSLLLEAADSRSALDSSATVAEFGPVLVKYGKVQNQINLKYDSWQKELQASFATILAQKKTVSDYFFLQ